MTKKRTSTLFNQKSSAHDHLSTLYKPVKHGEGHVWSARRTHFRHRDGILTIKTPLLHTCARKFWYFPLLKHDIIPKK